MIRLISVLRAQGITLERYKIHLATTGSTSPLEAYFQGKFKEWQEGQNAKNFECDMVVGLVHRGGDRWLFAGVYRILGAKKGVTTPYQYETELLPGQDDLVGRVVVRYRRVFRASYIWGDKYGDDLEVAEILDAPLSIQKFDGYNKVLLKYPALKIIIDKQEPSWCSALSSIKGVYLIMDTETGSGYVGSAYGSGGIWERWCAYAATGHGGNIELKALLETKGANYVANFQYSILEIADPSATGEQVLERECHWKDALMSRSFGYNSN
jgi:hypothetical protein